MSRRIVRVDIPRRQPDRLIELAQKVVAQHESEGDKSPFAEERISRLRDTLTAAATHHNQAESLGALASGARHRRDEVLGIAGGQNLASPDTLLCQVIDARKQLEVHFRGHEQAMEAYGFNVVTGVARNPRPKKGDQADPIA